MANKIDSNYGYQNKTLYSPLDLHICAFFPLYQQYVVKLRVQFPCHSTVPQLLTLAACAWLECTEMVISLCLLPQQTVLWFCCLNALMLIADSKKILGLTKSKMESEFFQNQIWTGRLSLYWINALHQAATEAFLLVLKPNLPVTKSQPQLYMYTLPKLPQFIYII